MKYLVFSELSNEDWDKLSEAGKKQWADREKHPDKYPAKILTDHLVLSDLPTLTKDVRGMVIYETDDPQQLKNWVAYWTARGIPSLKYWFIPIEQLDVNLVEQMKK